MNLVLHIFITGLQGAPSEEMLTEGCSNATELDGIHQPGLASYTLLRGLLTFSPSRVSKVPVPVPLVIVTTSLVVSIEKVLKIQ